MIILRFERESDIGVAYWVVQAGQRLWAPEKKAAQALDFIGKTNKKALNHLPFNVVLMN